MTLASLSSIDKLSPSRLDRMASGLTYGLILIHFLALISVGFILFSPPAHADEDLTCGARDLVADLEKSDPAAYQKLKAQGDKVKNSTHRFWKLEKAGQPTDWLLGTIHVADPRVTDLPPEAKAAYDSAKTVILESDEILDAKKASLKLFAQPGLMMFTDAKTLVDYLSPDDQKVLEKALMGRGIPLGSVVKMKPYILTSMVALSTCEISRKSKGVPFLDQKLAVEAQAAGKEVKGVETLQEQIEAMASMPMEFHIRSLMSTVRYPDYTRDMLETTIKLYLRSEIGMIFPAGAYFAPEKKASDFKDINEFENRLVTQRNHHMADRGESMLAKGDVFMAVGALHLIGDEGLVELFRAKGYTVTPVD